MQLRALRRARTFGSMTRTGGIDDRHGTQTVEVQRVDDRVTFILDSTPLDVRKTLVALAGSREMQRLSRESLGRVQIVLGELLNNVVEHAYENQAGGFVQLDVWVCDGLLKCRLQDGGKPMPELTAPDGVLPPTTNQFDMLPEGGFGWFLIHELTHDLYYDRVNDKNLLSFSLPL
ncbi:MAG: serine/threonine-protein kinase RsbW [Paracoccaceae bacterium]|jgi:serine/threonine-protein kinase RsbW